ncbi:hypothetical protein R3P38DRAFT_3056235 [Favolaschia claudopus]|uniref:Secreted protein n=1 Tax=Favolaschia claudopus TaxID=2862362 RepID=A0AAW0A480_9AGAR
MCGNKGSSTYLRAVQIEFDFLLIASALLFLAPRSTAHGNGGILDFSSEKQCSRILHEWETSRRKRVAREKITVTGKCPESEQ